MNDKNWPWKTVVVFIINGQPQTPHLANPDGAKAFKWRGDGGMSSTHVTSREILCGVFPPPHNPKSKYLLNRVQVRSISNSTMLLTRQSGAAVISWWVGVLYLHTQFSKAVSHTTSHSCVLIEQTVLVIECYLLRYHCMP